jgi:single-stranded DNA-specific DHH superfamily exonuclease
LDVSVEGNDPDNPVAQALMGKGRVAVVHHWDADGITSAALVIEEARRVSPTAEVINRSPTIGRWFLGPEEIAQVRAWGPDLLVLVDLAIRDDDLMSILNGLEVPVLMVDHHRAEVPRDTRVQYHNPVAQGDPEEENPACSWVLGRLLGRRADLLTVLGVFGDRGRGVENEPIWPRLRAFLEESGLEEIDMHNLVDLVDSSAKRMDVKAVDAAVGHLLDGWRDPRALLKLPEWNAAAAEVESAMVEQLERGPETVLGQTLVKTIDTPYLVISTAARRLIRTRGQPVVVVVNLGYSSEETQMYIRRLGDLDLSPMIGQLRDKGLSSGGKGEVVGVIAPDDMVDEVVGDILEFLCAHGYTDETDD